MHKIHWHRDYYIYPRIHLAFWIHLNPRRCAYGQDDQCIETIAPD